MRRRRSRMRGRAAMGAGPGLVLAGGGALALGVAEWAEHVLGMVPCGLCLWERWPYRLLLVLGLLAAAFPPARRWPLRLCVPVLLAACVLSGVHVGVEQGWWPSPLAECQAPVFHGGTFAERLAAMPARPAKPCDAPAYLLDALPLSMTALGGIYALMLLAVTMFVLGRDRRTGSR
ncbi:disulfide bond formation protein B [Gluconacetobacter azotocaptans]|uniref:disulfide bond formation protein B n=1 Tax=Gluconacetobacter azotocaptans TaxID=142834 RepID=UPI001F03489B|nr:disulfide bond formation protein B [Gluconacetobacter azotocaptans]